MKLEKAFVTFTGGMDSTLVAYEVCRKKIAKEVVFGYVNYGQASSHHSWDLLSFHAKECADRFRVQIKKLVLCCTIPEFKASDPLGQRGYVPPYANEKVDYAEQKKSYDYALIDGRNAFIFLTIFAYCSRHKIPVVYTGHQMEPTEWENIDSYRHRQEDFTPMFIDRMNLLQEVGFENRVRIEAPLVTYRMSKLEIAATLKERGIDIDKTYSCQFYPACGKCDNCINRRNILEQLV